MGANRNDYLGEYSERAINMVFTLSEIEQERVDKWLVLQRELGIAKEKSEMHLKSSQLQAYIMESHDMGFPHGESITYSFTPTGIGVAVSVRYNLTESELDVTDYDSW